MKSSFIHLIIALGVCTALTGSYFWWYGTITDKSVAVASLQSRIDAKTEATARTNSARTVLADLTSDETLIRNYFVPETGVVAFITDLETRGRSLGATVTILSVSTGGTTKQPTLAFAISAKGTFDAVVRTVGAIEYAPYAISISKLTLGQEDTSTWRASLNLIVGSVAATAATTTP